MSESSNEYGKFKELLESFVGFLANKEDKVRGGEGCKVYNSIQNQIVGLKKFSNGKIYITVQHHPTNGYKSTLCYLTWMPLTPNIHVYAKWDGNKVKSLYQMEYVTETYRKDLGCEKSIEELGLFDGKKEVTEDLKVFFDEYNKHLLAFKEKKKNETE